MCELALVGSVLVACAQFGGYVLGADIDWNMVHGRGKMACVVDLLQLLFPRVSQDAPQGHTRPANSEVHNRKCR